VFELGTGINELQVKRSRFTLRRMEGLPQGQHSLLSSNGTTLQHQPILSDDTIVREPTNRGDVLLSVIILSGSIILLSGLSNTVDLFVDLGTMMVTILTGTRDRVLNTRRMPSSNTSNLPETLPGLTRKLGNTPTSGHSFKTFTLGDTKRMFLRNPRTSSVNLPA
jgi:hypothetical protein